MFKGFRYIPPVCLFVSLFQIMRGRLKYSYQFLNKSVRINKGNNYTIFRQITRFPADSSENNCVFIVQFKFKHLSHKVNRIVSKIPMLLITGHPGFVSKCYAVNYKNGYWMGMYQWKSKKHLEDYKKSFVYKMMNRRANPETIQSNVMPNQTLDFFIHRNMSN